MGVQPAKPAIQLQFRASITRWHLHAIEMENGDSMSRDCAPTYFVAFVCATDMP